MVKTQKNIQKTGRMEEAADLEEKKYIFSFIFHKIVEEWKKLGKDIQKTWQKL